MVTSSISVVNRIFCVSQIYICTVDMVVNKEILVNSTMEDVYIHHLQQNVTYQLQMSAFNHNGESVASEVIWIGKSFGLVSHLDW